MAAALRAPPPPEPGGRRLTPHPPSTDWIEANSTAVRQKKKTTQRKYFTSVLPVPVTGTPLMVHMKTDPLSLTSNIQYMVQEGDSYRCAKHGTPTVGWSEPLGHRVLSEVCWHECGCLAELALVHYCCAAAEVSSGKRQDRQFRPGRVYFGSCSCTPASPADAGFIDSRPGGGQNAGSPLVLCQVLTGPE